MPSEEGMGTENKYLNFSSTHIASESLKFQQFTKAAQSSLIPAASTSPGGFPVFPKLLSVLNYMPFSDFLTETKEK